MLQKITMQNALENMLYVVIAVSSLLLHAPVAFLLQAIAVSWFNMFKTVKTEETEETEETENYIELILPFYMVFLAAIQPYGNIKFEIPNAWFYDF